ncbi:hypothetical protein GCM10023084_16480 [Streptomyces lacrimifluminis]|uniref:Major facilitator superfamily (MFS) profile domain-containing protein n=1 Tax=Streptomyces lacrimifluminis TaxID=1500077 RepID=A0A917KEX3_9ACTN|nr:hypothetical protein GCM10012282_00850 [Streptomyces lacrimifluminis]
MLVAGVMVFAAGLLLLATADGTGSYGPLLLGMIVCGAGFGTFFTTAAMTATGDVPDADQGLAGGLINTATQIGTALGIAVLLSPANRTAADQGAPTPADVSDGFGLAAQVAAVSLAVVSVFALATLRRPRDT